MSKVKELDETHGISLGELISVFHVLHRDVDGRVPLREIVARRAGGSRAGCTRANLQAAPASGGRRQGGRRGARCDCARCPPARAVGALALARGRPPVRAGGRRGRKRANTDDGGGRGGDRAEALGESEEFTHSDRDRSELSGGDASRRSGSVRRARRDVEHRLVERKVRSENAGHVRGARGGGASSSESGGRSDSGEDSEGVSANSGSFRSLYPSSDRHLEFDDFVEGAPEAARHLSACRRCRCRTTRPSAPLRARGRPARHAAAAPAAAAADARLRPSPTARMRAADQASAAPPRRVPAQQPARRGRGPRPGRSAAALLYVLARSRRPRDHLGFVGVPRALGLQPRRGARPQLALPPGPGHRPEGDRGAHGGGRGGGGVRGAPARQLPQRRQPVRARSARDAAAARARRHAAVLRRHLGLPKPIM